MVKSILVQIEGTSHLNRHIPKCLMIPKSDDMRDMMLDYAAKMRSRKLDHKVVRELTAQMIILHDLPFQRAEWGGFRTLCRYLSFGETTAISRNTITTDVMKIYLLEKEKLKNNWLEFVVECVRPLIVGQLALLVVISL